MVIKTKTEFSLKIEKDGFVKNLLMERKFVISKMQKFLIDLFQCLYIPHENRRYRKGPVKFNVLIV